MRFSFVLFVAIFCSGSWCELCKLLPGNNEDAENKFAVGDAYSIMSGSRFRNLEKKEPTQLEKMQWHSWIEIFSSNGCIYSFGLTGDAMGGPVEVSTPDLTVGSCFERGLACNEALKKGKKYKEGDKFHRLKIAPTELNGCRYVCKGIADFVPGGYNSNYPIFSSLHHGNLSHKQVEIIRWLLRNQSRSNKLGYRYSEVPFKYSIACSVPGVKTLHEIQKITNPKIQSAANCRTFASDFHDYPGELLETLRTSKH